MKRHNTIFWIIAFSFVVTITLGAAIVNAQEREPSELPTPAEYFTDVKLTNQDGIEKRLYTDLLKDKLVVVSVFNLDCEGDCPPIMKRLAEVQGRLGSRLGQDVSFISLSIDPRIDSINKMKQYADKLGVKGGWDFLTGDESSLRTSLEKFGQGSHDSTILLIGNESTGDWKMTSGLATPDVIYATLTDMMSDSAATFTMNMDD